MIYETPYIITEHDAFRAGRHFDLRIQYLRKEALASWALPKAKFPEFGEKILAVKTPDHSLDWLEEHPPIPKGEYGGGTFKTYQKGTAEILGWGTGFITFRLSGENIKGKFTLIRTSKTSKSDQWILIRSKEKEEIPNKE